jgi:hopanoid biosynthesis associated RND transporter like protein HpnN
MDTPEIHPMERLLHRLAAIIARYRGWFIYPQVLLFGVCLMFTSRNLELQTNPDDLVSTGEDYVQHWQELEAEFEVREDLVTLVESDDLEKNRQFVERLGARLEEETDFFNSIYYKKDLRALGDKGLLFLSEEQLRSLLRGLTDYEELIGTFQQVTNLASLFVEVDQRMRSSPPEEAEGHPLIAAVPAMRRIVDQGVDSIIRPGIPPSPGLTTLFAEGAETVPGDYLQFGEGRFYVVTCSVVPGASERGAILRLRELVMETQMEVSGVNVGVTGQPVLRYEEMRQARGDTTLASWVALSIVALTFILCYNEVKRPLKATACLVVGIGYTLGFTTLTIGHLNLLTITFIPILIGLAIDFGVHLITRFEEELREGRSRRTALEKALVVSGSGICTGGLATAAAFLAMTFTGFRGIREMGFISGGGLLVCLVPMLTMLPALLLQGKPEGPRLAPSTRKARRTRRETFERSWLDRPRTVVGIGLALTLLAGSQMHRLRFDFNLLNLQSQGLSAIVFERKMQESPSRSVLACLITADSIDEAIALENRVRELDSVVAVTSVAPLLAGDQQNKLDLVRQIREVASTLRLAPMDAGPVSLSALDRGLESFNEALVGAIYEVGRAGEEGLKQELRDLRESVFDWRNALASDASGAGLRQLTYYQQALFTDLATTLQALKQQEFRTPLTTEDLPAALRSRFVGRTGKYLLQVYPRENVWDRGPQEAFVNDLRAIDPTVTGPPVRFYEFTSLLKSNFQRAALYALLTIILMLLLHFRNVVCMLLALLPVLVGIVWTLGAMAVLGMPFNPANVISLPLLIGIGVSSGVHILNRFTEEKHPSILGKSTGKAVMVSALTTATGFGSLMLAEHAGIASLGKVMAMGAALCMVAALTVLPAALLLLKRAGWKLAHGWISQ